MESLIAVISAADPYTRSARAIADLVVAAGFVPVGGAAHTSADRVLLTDTVCSADPDFDDYAEYVKVPARAAAAPIVEAVFHNGWGILR